MEIRRSLLALVVITIFVYTIRSINDEMLKEGKSFMAIVRRITIGAIGSALFVWWSYEAMKYYGFPDGLSLATAGAVGYLGADVVTRFIEKFLDKLVDNFGFKR